MAASDQNHTDVSHLLDHFDPASWGPPEHERHPAPKEHAGHMEMHEYVEDEPLPDISQFMRSKTVSIDLPKDLRDMGVQVVEPPVQYPKHQTVTIPLTDDKIAIGKEMPLDSAFRWLAEVCERLLKTMNIRLKIAHGKAVRVMEG